MFSSNGNYPTVYFGLLGRRGERDIPETEVALGLLEKNGIMPQLIYVTISLETLQEWRDMRLPYQWITAYEADIADIDSVKNRVKPQLQILLKDYGGNLR